MADAGEAVPNSSNRPLIPRQLEAQDVEGIVDGPGAAAAGAEARAPDASGPPTPPGAQLVQPQLPTSGSDSFAGVSASQLAGREWKQKDIAAGKQLAATGAALHQCGDRAQPSLSAAARAAQELAAYTETSAAEAAKRLAACARAQVQAAADNVTKASDAENDAAAQPEDRPAMPSGLPSNGMNGGLPRRSQARESPQPSSALARGGGGGANAARMATGNTGPSAAAAAAVEVKGGASEAPRDSGRAQPAATGEPSVPPQQVAVITRLQLAVAAVLLAMRQAGLAARAEGRGPQNKFQEPGPAWPVEGAVACKLGSDFPTYSGIPQNCPIMSHSLTLLIASAAVRFTLRVRKAAVAMALEDAKVHAQTARLLVALKPAEKPPPPGFKQHWQLCALPEEGYVVRKAYAATCPRRGTCLLVHQAELAEYLARHKCRPQWAGLRQRPLETESQYSARLGASGVTFRKTRLDPQPLNPIFDTIRGEREGRDTVAVVLSSYDSEAGAAHWPILRPAWGPGARVVILPDLVGPPAAEAAPAAAAAPAAGAPEAEAPAVATMPAAEPIAAQLARAEPAADAVSDGVPGRPRDKRKGPAPRRAIRPQPAPPPPPPPVLPPGFHYFPRWHPKVQPSGRRWMFIFLAAECKQHGLDEVLLDSKSVADFVAAHSSCMPGCAHLARGEGESGEAYQERLSGLGLRISSAAARPGQSAVDAVQSMIPMSDDEAEAVLRDYRGGCLTDGGCCPALDSYLRCRDDWLDWNNIDAVDVESGSDGDDDSPADGITLIRRPPTGFSNRMGVVRKENGPWVQMQFEVKCQMHRAGKMLVRPRQARRFLADHGLCRPEWTSLMQRTHETDREHTQRLAKSGLHFQQTKQVCYMSLVDMTVHMLPFTDRAAAEEILLESGFIAKDMNVRVGPEPSSRVAAGTDNDSGTEGNGTAAAQPATPGIAGGQAGQRLPDGFSVRLSKEDRAGPAAFNLRIYFHAQCSAHGVDVSLRRYKDIARFLRRHAGCRPEWQALAQKAEEDDLDFAERMKTAGLRFKSRVMHGHDSLREMVLELLDVSADEAGAIVAASNLAGCRRHSAGADASPAAGRQEEREDSAPLEDGACAHPLQPLPTGMTREGRIKETPEGRYKVMVQLRLDCAFDYASRVLRGYSELRNFLDTHALCMPEWLHLGRQKRDTDETFTQRLKDAGISFPKIVLPSLEAAQEWLEGALQVSAQGAASLVSHARQGGEDVPDQTPEAAEPEEDDDDMDVDIVGEGPQRRLRAEPAAGAVPATAARFPAALKKIMKEVAGPCNPTPRQAAAFQVAVSDSAAQSADVLLARVEMLEGDVKTLRGSLKQSNAVNKKLEDIIKKQAEQIAMLEAEKGALLQGHAAATPAPATDNAAAGEAAGPSAPPRARAVKPAPARAAAAAAQLRAPALTRAGQPGNAPAQVPATAANRGCGSRAGVVLSAAIARARKAQPAGVRGNGGQRDAQGRWVQGRLSAAGTKRGFQRELSFLGGGAAAADEMLTPRSAALRTQPRFDPTPMTLQQQKAMQEASRRAAVAAQAPSATPARPGSATRRAAAAPLSLQPTTKRVRTDAPGERASPCPIVKKAKLAAVPLSAAAAAGNQRAGAAGRPGAAVASGLRPPQPDAHRLLGVVSSVRAVAADPETPISHHAIGDLLRFRAAITKEERQHSAADHREERQQPDLECG